MESPVEVRVDDGGRVEGRVGEEPLAIEVVPESAAQGIRVRARSDSI